MSSVLLNLLRVKKKDVSAAVTTLSKSFFDDDITEFIFPEKNTREQYLMEYFKFRLNYGILYGEVYTTSSEFEGVVNWISPKNIYMTPLKMMRAGGMRLFFKLGKDRINKMMKVSSFTTDLQQTNIVTPHWFLSPIGVLPNHQGKGFASKLIRPMLERFDDNKEDCFLETQNKNNVEIYKRYGFEVIAKGVIPGANLDHWVMIRKNKGK